MLDRLKREPALISGLVAAAIALVTAFGLELSNEQVGVTMAVTAAVLAIVTRQSVTPNIAVAAKSEPPAAQPVAGPAAEGINDPVDVLSDVC